MKVNISMVGRKRRLNLVGVKEWFEERFVLFLGCTALLLTFTVLLVVLVHFKFGKNIWYFEMKNSQTAQFWGQVGDFIGGLLNPILSFFALIAVLFNLVLQRKELSLARKDAKDAHDTQKRQSEIFEIQNFESVFFRLLDAHSRLAVSVKSKFDNAIVSGVEGFDQSAVFYLPAAPVLKNDKFLYVRNRAAAYVGSNVDSVGHYYRSLYQILKYIDSYGQVAVNLSEATMTRINVRRSVRNYQKQRVYSNILRAQLSNSEIICVFLNCLTPEGAGLKNYIEKYSLLKTLKLPLVYGGDEDVKQLYEKIAFSGSEKISSREIVEASERIYMRRLGKRGDIARG